MKNLRALGYSAIFHAAADCLTGYEAGKLKRFIQDATTSKLSRILRGFSRRIPGLRNTFASLLTKDLILIFKVTKRTVIMDDLVRQKTIEHIRKAFPLRLSKVSS
jgi:hypothetical protein